MHRESRRLAGGVHCGKQGEAYSDNCAGGKLLTD